MLLAIRTSLVALALAGTLLAHAGAVHFTGTVKAIALEALTLETTKHEVMVIGYVAKTKVVKNKTAAKWTDIKVGERVVVHATKNKIGVWEAQEVDFGATPAPAQAKPSAR